ncbi:MAG: type II secretion system F family protein [Acidimicrobiales bacterium]
MALLASVLSAYGVFLIATGLGQSWSGIGLGPRGLGRPRVRALADHAELGAVVALAAVLGAAVAYALFGGAVPMLVAAGGGAAAPLASHRARQARRRAEAQDAWPRLIEEMRLQIGSLGRSVPQALLDVGARGPDLMRPAFGAARREWLITTDFARTVALLEHQLGDPTADAVCETLLVAHEVGGSEIDGRLAALAEDRRRDAQHRRDCRSRQSGVRFARRFVLLVPLGMTIAGLGIGDGRAAFAGAGGQLGVVVAMVIIALCWAWAGRLLQLPPEPRLVGGAPQP